jgi:tripartite-type tricarboxylate transporter receptor subunit TctC
VAHLKRIRLLLACFLVLAMPHAFAASPGAANFPQKPLRIIVSSAPGGGQDLTVRPIAQQLSERLGVAVVVDNRGGASGVIAMDVTRQSAPDGYTLLAGATSIILMGVTGKVSYDMRKAFEPVAHLTSQPYLFVAHPSLPARTPGEFIAFAKTRPGVLTYGTSGPGSLHNLGMDLLQSITGTKLVHVPYKGSGPALVDLLAGQIDLMFTSTTSGAAHVRSGKLRALAITSRNRIAAYPDLPTLSETVAPGYELGNIYYLLAPAGTPASILKTLNAEISRILNLPQIRDKFVAEGVTPVTSQTVEQFRDEYLREIDKWERFTKHMKLQLS